MLRDPSEKESQSGTGLASRGWWEGEAKPAIVTITGYE